METTVKTTYKEAFLADLQAPKVVEAAQEIVSAGQNALEGLDFPANKAEDWKYTRVAPIAKGQFIFDQELRAIATESYKIKDLEGHLLVFVNGIFDAEASQVLEEKEGVIVSTVQQALENHTEKAKEIIGARADNNSTIFAALNAAYLQDGVFVYAPKNVELAHPVQVINVITGDNVLVQPRNVIFAERGAIVQVVENFVAENAQACLNNVVTEITVEENAQVVYDKIQAEEGNVFHIGSEFVRQDQNSVFTINTMTLNGQFVRNGLNIAVAGQNCETNLYGAYITKGTQHVDNHTKVDHLVAHCTSNEMYKGILDEKSTGVFNGKVYVHQDAQKIEAYQSNGNVLLSDNSRIFSKPELEIYADDVQCSHGCTIGQLDEDAVFYLQARGVSKENARKLLVDAFVRESFAKIKLEAVQNHVDAILKNRFGWEF